jgi:tryptophan 2,3-dioxygenase
LFIVIHQVYGLVQAARARGAHLQRRLEDGDTTHALHTLKRMLTLEELGELTDHIMETVEGDDTTEDD